MRTDHLKNSVRFLNVMAGETRIELATFGFGDQRSTN